MIFRRTLVGLVVDWSIPFAICISCIRRKMLNVECVEKWRRKKDLEQRRNAYYSYTLPVGAGARGVPHLRHRLAAPGRLTAMCHDRRTNAGNLQFSFALIDHTVAGKAFALAKQDCISNRGIVFLSPYSLFHFALLRFVSTKVYFIQQYPIIYNIFKRRFNSVFLSSN